MPYLARALTFLIAAVAGAVYGVVGTVAQASTLWGIPIGLVLAVIGAAALILAIRLLSDRWTALAAGAGLTLAVVVFSGEGPGGSVIAPADSPYSLIWTFACPLLAGLVVAWPQLEAAFDRGRDDALDEAGPAEESLPRT